MLADLQGRIERVASPNQENGFTIQELPAIVK
jgi:hypothetical protein